MLISQEIRLRQFIWAEYRAGSSKEQALINIKSKFGPEYASESTIEHWYQRFVDGNANLFEQYNITSVIQTLPNGKEV
jgi:hypothetical protein